MNIHEICPLYAKKNLNVYGVKSWGPSYDHCRYKCPAFWDCPFFDRPKQVPEARLKVTILGILIAWAAGAVLALSICKILGVY